MELKVLFLVFHGFSAHNGISKKIFGQVKGLQECGAKVRLCYYDVLDNGHRAWIVDGEIIADLGKGPWAKSRKRWDFSCLTSYVSKEQFDLIDEIVIYLNYESPDCVSIKSRLSG